MANNTAQLRQLMRRYSPLDHEQAVKTVFSTGNLPLSPLFLGERRALAQHSLDIPVRFVLLPTAEESWKHRLDLAGEATPQSVCYWRK